MKRCGRSWTYGLVSSVGRVGVAGCSELLPEVQPVHYHSRLKTPRCHLDLLGFRPIPYLDLQDLPEESVVVLLSQVEVRICQLECPVD